MFVYWLMFFIPVFALFSPSRMTTNARDWSLRAICILFTFFIGLRYEVGGDWFVYAHYYQAAVGQTLLDLIPQRDPAYEFLTWLAASYDWGVSSVNLICAAVVMVGVYHFCRRQPQPWLALIVAVPYMLIVFAMGYTRQSAALGFELLALLALGDGRLQRFFILIVCAALFHKSAVVLLPLWILASTNRPLWLMFAMIGMSVLIAGVLLLEQSEALINTYSGMQSEGGAIRVAMNAIPAVMFLIFSKRFAPLIHERKLWTWMAIFSLVCIPLLPLAPAATDRIALYFLPIQIFVFSRIGRFFRQTINYSAAVFFIVAGYGLVLWVLLNKATNVSVFWVPYNSVAFPW